MQHINKRLTERVELGARRIERWDLEVVRTDDGGEVRNSRTSQPLLRFEIGYPPARRDDPVFKEVQAAYVATRGGRDSLRFRDWSDHSAIDQSIGTGDSSTQTFQLSKTYTFGSQSHVRYILNPALPIALKVNGIEQGSGYTVDDVVGTVTFDVAPAVGAAITWTGEFDVPVRFDGELSSTAIAIHLEHHQGIVLEEVRSTRRSEPKSFVLFSGDQFASRLALSGDQAPAKLTL